MSICLYRAPAYLVAHQDKYKQKTNLNAGCHNKISKFACFNIEPCTEKKSFRDWR